MTRDEEGRNDPGWLLPVFEYAGESVEPLRRLGQRVEATPARLTELLGVAEDGEAGAGVAALWLIKHWLENGAQADAAMTERFVRLLDREEPAPDPHATLHLLQILPYLPEPLPEPARLFAAAERLTRASHAFLRAWAYNALALVGHQHPAFEEEAEFRMMRAQESDTAAVRARIRKARAGKFPART